MTAAPGEGRSTLFVRSVIAISYAGLIARAFFLWHRGLSPPALGQDDLWVGFLVKYASLADLWTYSAPVPMGFVAWSQVFHGLLPDPEWSLQVLPFACGLALVPLAGWVAARLTGRWEVGLLAAALVLLHPLLGGHAVRVKQFTWDAAAMLLLLGVGMERLDPERPERPWSLAIASSVALFISFNTVFLGAILCHLRVLMTVLRRSNPQGSVRRAVFAALAFDTFAAALYLLRVRHQSGDWIVAYWQKQGAFPTALPTLWDPIDLEWLSRAVFRAFSLWLPHAWRELAWLAPVGVLVLVMHRRHRWQGFTFLGLGVLVVLAALWRLYPLGGIRTDYYFQPILAVLAAVAIAEGTSVLTGRYGATRSSGDLARRIRTGITLAVAVALLVLVPVQPAKYGAGTMTTQYKDLVATVDAKVLADDLLILTPVSRWNLGYYTTRPLRVSFVDPKQKLFDFTLTQLNSRVTWRIEEELRHNEMPQRVSFLAYFAGPEALAIYHHEFRRLGYRLVSEKRTENQGSAFQIWVRPKRESGIL